MFYIGETQEIVFKREIEEVKRTTTYIQEEKTLLESKQLELQQVFKQKTTELESKSSYLTEQMTKITTDIKDVNKERKDVKDVVEKLQQEEKNIGTNIKEIKLKMESQSISISDFEKTIKDISKMFENIEKKHQTIFLEIEKLNALLHDSIQPHIKGMVIFTSSFGIEYNVLLWFGPTRYNIRSTLLKSKIKTY